MRSKRVSSTAVRLLRLVVATAICASAPAAAEPAPFELGFEGCDAPRCLGVGIEPEALERLASGEGADAEQLAEALSVRVRTAEPLYVRLFAARYRDGRLVRYGVSDRYQLEPSGDPVALGTSLKALHGAFRPVTERAIRLRLVDGVAGPRVAMEGMVGTLPPSYLVAADDVSGLLVLDDADAAAAADAFRGTIGVVAVLLDVSPIVEQTDLRQPSETQSFAVLLTLDMEPR